MGAALSQKELTSENSRIPIIRTSLQNKQWCDIAGRTLAAEQFLNGNGESERVFAPSVTANLLSVLGVDAIRGRTFQTDEDKQGGPASSC